MSIWRPAEVRVRAHQCWSGSVAMHQQALLGSAWLLGGEDAAVGSHGFGMRLSHDRFLHKNPEDPSEVPGGFLSDLNPVSSGRSWGYGAGGG